MKLKIDRKYYDDCTVGRLTTNFSPFECWTLELPDRNNEQCVSCVPEGLYKAFKRFSPSKQCEVIQLRDVPNRSYIQIHVGNYTSQILGCILPGMMIKHIDGDMIPDVGNSEKAFQDLMDMLPDEFEVEIVS